MTDLSLAVPFFNESDGIDRFFSEIRKVLDQLDLAYEIVCVNDGSTDDTLARLMQYHREDPRVVVVDLSRNFGKEAATTAAIDHATGRAVIPFDADLQDPPEIIPQLLEAWKQGAKVVTARRSHRAGESWLKQWTAKVFYQFYNRISDTPIPPDTGDFRLMDREVVEALKNLPEMNRFMKGLFAWVGFPAKEVVFSRAQRASGQSKWNYWKLWNFALEGIFSFTTLPLRIWTYLGFLISVFSFLYVVFIIVRTLIFGIDQPGYASIMVVILFLGGIQLISLGIIGEYLGRIFNETKGRPVYLKRSLQNHGDAPASPEEPATARTRDDGQH